MTSYVGHMLTGGTGFISPLSVFLCLPILAGGKAATAFSAATVDEDVAKVTVYNGRAGESLWMKANQGCEANCQYTEDKETADAIVVSTWNGFLTNPVDNRELIFVSNAQPIGHKAGQLIRPDQVAIAETSDAKAFGGVTLWHLADFVNITIGYPQAANLWLSYAPTDFMDQLAKLPQPTLQNRPKLALWVGTRCSASWDRSGTIKEMMEYMDIDSRGQCMPNTDAMPYGVITEEHKQYKFIFHLENQLDPDFVTEKYFSAFLAGAIPVYYGAPNIQDYAPGPKSFIDMRDFSSAAALADYLMEVASDEQMYQQYFKWRRNPEPTETLDEAMENSQHTKSYLCKVCDCIRDTNCANVHSGEQLLDDHPDFPQQVPPFDLVADHNTEKDVRRVAQVRPLFAVNKAKPPAATAFGGHTAAKVVSLEAKIPRRIPPKVKHEELEPKPAERKSIDKAPQPEKENTCNLSETLRNMLEVDSTGTVDLIGSLLTQEQWKRLLSKNIDQLLEMTKPEG